MPQMPIVCLTPLIPFLGIASTSGSIESTVTTAVAASLYVTDRIVQ
ncbi:hypothetical protein SAMN04488011_101524 [Palleronia pelagia]|uniref:Uncharacterized protein n=1 Tax=Palleronia pelagia TaxID=387096 RepID=A0A1H8BAU7_9RHOB|nr:hypothetical protein SAMN04488011_101524 [Palleronia pelagia]